MIRATLRDICVDAGHEVLEARNAREALELLATQEVDVVCTDLGMPGMNGWQLADEIRDRWPHLRVGLMTGWGVRIEPDEVQTHNVNFLIAKPFSLDEILEALDGDMGGPEWPGNMGGPEMAPQTPPTLVAPRHSRGAPRYSGRLLAVRLLEERSIFPVPGLFQLGGWDEAERGRVDAVAEPGGLGAVGEEVAEVGLGRGRIAPPRGASRARCRCAR